MSGNTNTNRQRTLGSGGQHVLDYLKRMQAENPSFFYALHSDNNNNNNTNDHIHSSLGNIFWADPTSRMNYNYFGDAVVFDSSYKTITSTSRVPFASFTGLNHHGHPVLFGCALLLNEFESSFLWLFQTWLHAMSGRPPVSITTDPDRLIQLAVSQVLPQTRHRFCKWGIFRETRDKLAHVYQSHPTFELEFHKCINDTETIEEFESCWESLLDRYYLMDNEWLHSMYNARQQWVPVYMRDTFFGELSINETTSVGTNSFFDGYVTATTTIQTLLKQYEKAVAGWHDKELKADHDTTNTAPLLKTPSPMEKQAANLYTRRIFIKFQEELVETLANPATKIDDSGTVTTYRVAKFGEDHRAHTVRFNAFEMKASCSCQIFEFSGIICRHILAVFRAKNVLTLPSQYILKRWTRNAKSGAVLDEHASELPSNTRESLTVRFNNLRQEAIKYVEEGAKSIHIYNVAMDALQEASKKVASVKNGSLENSGNRDMPSSEENHMTPYQSADEKEKKICELTAELENTNQRCEVYRANLLAVLKDMEDQKLKLAVKVQNARLSLKEKTVPLVVRKTELSVRAFQFGSFFSKIEESRHSSPAKDLEEKDIGKCLVSKALRFEVSHGVRNVKKSIDLNENLQNQIPTNSVRFGNAKPEFKEQIYEEPEEIFDELKIYEGRDCHEQNVSQAGKTKEDAAKMAIKLLAIRAFTAVELGKKLQGKRFPHDIIEAVINDFQSRGLINDSLYAETFSHSRWSSSTWGPRRIMQALVNKGVSEADTEGALKLVFQDNESSEDQESRVGMSKLSMDQLFVQASKQWLRGQDVPLEKQKSRIIRWLQYRGFNWGVISFILKKLESQYPP